MGVHAGARQWPCGYGRGAEQAPQETPTYRGCKLRLQGGREEGAADSEQLLVPIINLLLLLKIFFLLHLVRSIDLLQLAGVPSDYSPVWHQHIKQDQEYH